MADPQEPLSDEAQVIMAQLRRQLPGILQALETLTRHVQALHHAVVAVRPQKD